MRQELTDRQSRIREALAAEFLPTELEIVDESHLHAGHAGARPEGETHFAVRIVSERFRGTPRVAQHRAVNDALKTEFETGLHALRISTAVPG